MEDNFDRIEINLAQILKNVYYKRIYAVFEYAALT